MKVHRCLSIIASNLNTEKVIDSLVEEIKTKFEVMVITYESWTLKRFGKKLDVFDKRHLNICDMVEFKHLEIFNGSELDRNVLKLIYTKKAKWFLPNMHKIFYAVGGWDFYAEKYSSDRYDFTVADYRLILSDIEDVIEQLKSLPTTCE